MAVAVLTCRSNSFPFQERQIALSEGQKIGRSVARARPGPTNGIFDCKVLSRNHALLWHEGEKFFLQDTKSSNGTFVNNERLSKGSEESSPHEIHSGDIIQFGVDVMESNRRGEKVTHACIIATATLYDENGMEAKQNSNVDSPCQSGGNVKSLEMYQLYQYLQDALHREKMLETKLNSLDWLLKNTQEACDNGWQALIDEDRLLSRIDVLEGQLLNYSKAHSEDTLRQELTSLQDDKHNYETTAKESLRRVLQEKLDAIKKCSDLELSLSNTELECSHVREICEMSQKELQQLAEKYDEQLAEVSSLCSQLQEAEQKYTEEQERVELEKEELHDRLSVALSQEAVLAAKLESLQAENDFAENQLKAFKSRLEIIKDNKNNRNNSDSDNEFLLSVDDVNIDDLVPLEIMKATDPVIEAQLKETQIEIKEYKDKIDKSEKCLQECKEKVAQLQQELESAECSSRQYVSKIASLEEKLCRSDGRVCFMLEATLSDLQIQLQESTKQSEGSDGVVKTLQESIKKLENELKLSTAMQSCPTESSILLNTPPTSNESRYNSTNSSDSDDDCTENPHSDDNSDVEAQLAEAQLNLTILEEEIKQYRDDLKASEDLVIKQNTELVNIKSDLSAVSSLNEERSHVISELHAQVKNANNVAKDLKQQLTCIEDQLSQSHQATKTARLETEHFRDECTSIRTECVKYTERIASLENDIKLRESHNQTVNASSLVINKDSLSTNNPSTAANESELDLTKQQVISLNKRISEYEANMAAMSREMDNVRKDYKNVADRSRMVSVLATIPLLLLFFALIVSLYPFLEGITATSL